MKTCHVECEDFSFEHCSNHLHDFRIKKCKYDPCLLLHDKYHKFAYDHKELYRNIADKNFIQNKNHPIFIEDIWRNIHEFLDDPKLTVACDCSIFKDRIKSVNNLLATSKIFSILLKTEFKSVNTWTYEKNIYVYKFNRYTSVSWKCYCDYPCLNCPDVKPCPDDKYCTYESSSWSYDTDSDSYCCYNYDSDSY
jgi:hypothetical protein